MFKTFSALSGGSLVVFGIASLVLSLWWSSAFGVVISVAILGHGIVELAARKRLLEKTSAKGAKVMIANQLALAMSVSLYAGWQVYVTDPEMIRNAMESPLVAQALSLYPPDTLLLIDAWLPRIILGFYFLVIAIVWLACAATAVYYRSAIRKLSISQCMK